MSRLFATAAQAASVAAGGLLLIQIGTAGSFTLEAATAALLASIIAMELG